MDKATVLAMLTRHWEYLGSDVEISHEIYHDDVIVEFPQGQERYVGKENVKAWRKRYPTSLKSKIRRIRGSGDFWVVEASISYNDGPWNFGIQMLEFRDGKVARETIYVTEGWEAPAWRAAWRAEWVEESSE